MFEAFRKHQRWVLTALLVLIIPSFVFFGIEGYSHFFQKADVLVEIDGQPITKQEFEKMHRFQVEKLRQKFGDYFDPAILESAEMQNNLLQQMVDERVLRAQVRRLKLTASNQKIQSLLLQTPGLSENGQFDVQRYQNALAAQGLTPEIYEAGLSQDLAMQQLGEILATSPFVSQTLVKNVLSITKRKFEVESHLVKADDFRASIKPTEAQLQAYYQQHGDDFKEKEKARIQYLILDLATVAQGINVSDQEAQAYYQKNAANYGGVDKRRASHILIAVAENASPAQKAQARAKAQSILQELKTQPKRFAELAKQESKDSVSARQGGDLGFLERGATVKPFEDALFALKTEGQMSDIVESQFGYHIIQLTGLQQAQTEPFAVHKEEIINTLKTQKAQQKFTELSTRLSDLLYEHAEALEPIAKQLGLSLRVVEGLERTKRGSEAYLNPKFLKALFTDAVLQKTQNTDAVEVAPNTLIAARVLDYQAAQKKTLMQVKSEVTEKVIKLEAQKKAQEEGQRLLQLLDKNPNAVTFSNLQTVSRFQPNGLPYNTIDALIAHNAKKLPGYVGVDAKEQGYLVYRINRVIQDPVVPTVADQKELFQVITQEEQRAFLAYSKELLKFKQIRKPKE